MSERSPGTRIAIAIGLAAAALIAAFLLLNDSGDSGDDGGQAGDGQPAPDAQPTDGPEAASADQLRALASSVEDPIYWAGEQSGELELTVERDGTVFIRYLAPGVPVGSRRVPSLTVGTYPYLDADGALRAVAKQPGAITETTPDGGLVVASKDNPSNVYIAYPDSDQQIEVFHPDPARALELATSGAIVPIS